MYFSLKTSLTKWKPDYDSAAVEYDRAGTTGVDFCFVNCAHLRTKILILSCLLQKLQKVRRGHRHLPEVVGLSREKRQRVPLCKVGRTNAATKWEIYVGVKHRGKEQAALMAKEAGDPRRATRLMEQAAQMYAESGSAETSAMALDKAARFLEQLDPIKVPSGRLALPSRCQNIFWRRPWRCTKRASSWSTIPTGLACAASFCTASPAATWNWKSEPCLKPATFVLIFLFGPGFSKTPKSRISSKNLESVVAYETVRKLSACHLWQLSESGRKCQARNRALQNGRRAGKSGQADRCPGGHRFGSGRRGWGGKGPLCFL